MKKENYKARFENLKDRTMQLLDLYMEELRNATHKDDEVPDVYIGFKLGEIHNQMSNFKLEVMDFDDEDEF